jgi:hypothetical protein
MNTLIEIHENNTAPGTHSIWLKHNKELRSIILSDSETNSLLNMGQKEDFFMGKWKFKIAEYDFKKLIEKL